MARIEPNAVEVSARKQLGAFYTDRKIADFLVEWAIRTPHDKVMDPSFGAGVFLESAFRRLRALGATGESQIFGVEINREVHTATSLRLVSEFGLNGDRFIRSDFFGIRRGFVPHMTAVIGNPPFIRFQRFLSHSRNRALDRAREQGVELSELSSSWAAFLIHSTALLQTGGRLAMVVPFEICQANYALPVLRYLLKSFRRLGVLTFKKKLFTNLNENTVLLLGEDKGFGSGSATLLMRDFASVEDLANWQWADSFQSAFESKIDSQRLLDKKERVIQHFLTPQARELYEALKTNPGVRPLGVIANVGIGYVTGANDFFHLDPSAVSKWNIPEAFLRKAIRRARPFAGLQLTEEDWERAGNDGGFLLQIPPNGHLPDPVRPYIRWGESLGIPARFKCRTRSPWYTVPHVHVADALLSYMSGDKPRFVANKMKAVVPNTLHTVRFRPLLNIDSKLIAAAWQNSIVRLSTEIEGHSLGGGMLKLEPREAESVLVPLPQLAKDAAAEFVEKLDCLIRSGRTNEAQDCADSIVLVKGLGLTRKDTAILRSAAETLRERRIARPSKYELP